MPRAWRVLALAPGWWSSRSGGENSSDNYPREEAGERVAGACIIPALLVRIRNILFCIFDSVMGVRVGLAHMGSQLLCGLLKEPQRFVYRIEAWPG